MFQKLVQLVNSKWIYWWAQTPVKLIRGGSSQCDQRSLVKWSFDEDVIYVVMGSRKGYMVRYLFFALITILILLSFVRKNEVWVGMNKILRGFIGVFSKNLRFQFSSVAFWLLSYLLRSCKIKRCWAQILQHSVPRKRIQIPHIFCDMLQNIANGISFACTPNYRKLGISRFMFINWKSFMVKFWFWNPTL